jgi:FixJ family two-component response regulator
MGLGRALLKQGVVEFLSKPVEPEKLVVAVSKTVQQSGYKDDHVT